MPVIFLSLILAIGVVLLLWPQPLRQTLKRTGPALLIGVAALAIAIVLQYTTERTITIKALDQKNAQSEGSEVWLKDVVVNGTIYPAQEFFSGGWMVSDEYLKWRSYDQEEGMYDQITASFDVGDTIQLIFDSNQWRGKVEIHDGWKVSTLDCYKASKNGTLVCELGKMEWVIRIPGKPLLTALGGVLCAAAGIAILVRRIWRKRNQNVVSTQVQRELWLDLLKVGSAFLVVLIHTIGPAYQTLPVGSDEWVAVLWLNSIPLCAVPIFIMISGVLVLNREIPFSKMRKNLLHGVILLLFWNIFYIFLQAVLWGPKENILTSIIALPTQIGPSGHLWYAYFIVWFYLFSPVFGTMYRALTMRQRIYFSAISLFLPSALDLYSKEVLHASATISSTALAMTINYMRMLFLGRIIYDLRTELSKKVMGVGGIVLALGGLSSMVCAAYRYGIAYGTPTDQYFMETHFFAILYATGVFLAAAGLSKISFQIPALLRHMVTPLSQYSLGIYFLHCSVMWMMGDIEFAGIIIQRNGTALSGFICCVTYYVLSVVAVCLIGQIPGLKKLVA